MIIIDSIYTSSLTTKTNWKQRRIHKQTRNQIYQRSIKKKKKKKHVFFFPKPNLKPKLKSEKQNSISMSNGNKNPGGHSYVRSIWECVTLTTPFSGFSATPETDLFTPSVSSHALRFPFFKKIQHF